MNIDTFLQHLSSDEKTELLSTILAATIEQKDGTLDPLQEIRTSDLAAFAGKTSELMSKVGQRVRQVAACKDLPSEELDESIQDILSSRGSDINNQGTEAQARFLIGEAGWTAEEVTKAATENE